MKVSSSITPIAAVFLLFKCMYLFAAPVQGSVRDIKPGERPVISGQEGLVFSGADEGEYISLSKDENILILKGNIRMDFDGKIVFSKRVVYNRTTGDVTLSGDVVFEDGVNRIYAEKCVFNVKDNAGVLYKAESVDKPVLFKSDRIRVVNKDTYITGETALSTCDLERPHYHFSVKKLTIYRDKRAIAYNAVYMVGDIPLFYFPVIVHSDDGIGIITQFGQGGRRGDFMQNTLNYTSGDGHKWKYKLDVYEKLGYYGGVEFTDNRGASKTYAYLAGAKYKYAEWSGSDWVNTSLPEGENSDWFRAVLNNDYSFNRRGSSYSYSALKFEWMNDSYFERNFDARGEPKRTFEMIGYTPSEIAERVNLYWSYKIGDKGSNHDISLEVKRQWRWDENIALEDIDDYDLKGRYVPYADQMPAFNFTYNNSFSLFGAGDKNNSGGQVINWKLQLAGNSYKSYSSGEYYSTTYTPYGYILLSSDFDLFKYLTYTPGIQNGFVAQWVKGPFNDDELARDSAELSAEKKTFQYFETSNALKLGLPEYYFQVTHYYRRSYLEKEIVEPFIHEKRNKFTGGIYLLPVPEIKLSATTSYDARSKYPFEEDRLKDITFNSTFFLDFNRLFYGKRSARNRDSGLFYSGLEVSDNYTYITKEKTPGYNTLDLKYVTGNFSLPGIKRVNSIELGYNFFHDYRFPFRDMMYFHWQLSADIFRLWRLEIGSGSQADRAYLLYNNSNSENIFDDLKKSLYFYDEERSRNAVFTLRNFFINVIHDLHCWEIGFFYNVQRKLENWGPQNRDSLIYYEQSFFVSLTLKDFSGAGFHRTQVYPLERRHEEEY